MLEPGHETLNNDLVMSKNAKTVEKITVAPEPETELQQSSEDTSSGQQGSAETRSEAVRRFENGSYPYSDKLGRRVYEEEKAALQVELLKVQKWVKERGEKIVLLFEGRDAAGKGGTIKRFMEHLNSRGAQVVALEKPSEAEKTQCTSSGISLIFPRQGKSSCLTAPGTTGLV